MASISSKPILLFTLALACMSTLTSANQGWFWGHNCTWPFRPPQSPPPSSRRLPPPPPLRRLPPSTSLSPPPSPPSQQLPPPTSPSQRLPPPTSPSKPPSPSRRPRTPPSRQLPSPPPPPSRSRRPRTPPSRRVPPPPSSPSLPPPPPSVSPSPSPSPPSSPITPQNPRKIIVGGSEHWHLGFNYNDWALKNGPFYLNDILVFKYDPPNSSTPPHNVYLLPNMRSFVNCDFRRAKMVANLTRGSGDGFEFELKQQNPYYFACGEGNGFHCKSGSMKFSVTPIVQG